MDERDKQIITTLRQAGRTYAEIEKATGLQQKTIGAYCRKAGIEPLEMKIPEGICPECGKHVEQPSRGRRRTFCSEACRRTWWNKHGILSRRSDDVTHHVRCKCCGKEFIAYRPGRKYCSYDCYITSRFGAVSHE